jgi:A/G-specific adenine glycosylase
VRRNQAALLAWYDRNKRDLPWRRTSDPYAVWVSEIMLQQTQVATVIPYWHRWMERFPTVEALAAAEEQDVLSLWQGLGYYRRCRFLLAGARWVCEHGMPSTAEAWLSVPGVGRYTAGAIASIANGARVPVVDGNVERVYARLTGDASADRALHEAAWTWAKKNLDRERPGDWNQALMELGATVCKPVAPSCDVCPLIDRCVARQSWRVEELPTKAALVKIIRLRQIVWAPICDGRFGLRQIPAGQWWDGMWEFPRVPADGSVEPVELRRMVGEGWPESVGTIRHSVTNHRIAIDVYRVRCEVASSALAWFTREELTELPLPAPQRRVLKLVS